MDKKLSPKQAAFVDAYIELGNATAAAKAAGYKCKSERAYGALGFENLKKLEKFINTRLEEIRSARTADLTETMEFITSVMRGEVEDEIINPITGMKERLVAGARDRLGAAKELLKRYPRKIDDERQQLELEKLRLQIREMGAEGDSGKVMIFDDIEAGIEAD